MKSEYDKLKEQGYSEEEIQFLLEDQMSTISLSDAPMGPGRLDKGATLTSKTGEVQKTSSIMVGFDRKGLNLQSGDYVEAEELVAAIIKEVSQNGEDKIIVCKKTGKKVEPRVFANDVVAELFDKTAIEIKGKSSKITNQTAYDYSVGDEKSERIFMAGNHGVDLPSGDYVSVEELQAALQDYVFMSKGKEEPVIPPVEKGDPNKVTPDPKPVIPSGTTGGGGGTPDSDSKPPVEKEEEEEEKNEIVPVTKRKRSSKIIATIAMITMVATIALSGLGRDKVVAQHIDVTHSNNADYSVTQMAEEDVLETEEEAFERALNDYETGGKIHADEGVTYYESSQEIGRNAEFGGKYREAGDYTLEYVSVVDENNNEILKVEYREGVNVQEIVSETLEENGLGYENVRIMVHAGGPVSGWVDLTDIMSEEELTPEVIAQHFVESETITGTEVGYEGTITIGSGDEAVTIKTTDENGNSLGPGSMVVGSDGQTYRINDLAVHDIERTTITSEVVDGGISWSVDHMKEHAPLTAAAVFAESAVFTALIAGLRKKEKEAKAEEAYAESKKEVESEFDKVIVKVTEATKMQTINPALVDGVKPEELTPGTGGIKI